MADDSLPFVLNILLVNAVALVAVALVLGSTSPLLIPSPSYTDPRPNAFRSYAHMNIFKMRKKNCNIKIAFFKFHLMRPRLTYDGLAA